MSKTNTKMVNFMLEIEKNKNKNLKKDLDGIEGFDVISRINFKKKIHPNFDIPQGADPGQMVMCELRIKFGMLN